MRSLGVFEIGFTSRNQNRSRHGQALVLGTNSNDYKGRFCSRGPLSKRKKDSKNSLRPRIERDKKS